VYAIVLPFSVALAVVLQVGFHWAFGTVAVVGTVASMTLLVIVPLAYTQWTRTRGTRNRVAAPSRQEFETYWIQVLREKAREHLEDPDKSSQMEQYEEVLRTMRQRMRDLEPAELTEPRWGRDEMYVQLHIEVLHTLTRSLPSYEGTRAVLDILTHLNQQEANRWPPHSGFASVYREAIFDLVRALTDQLVGQSPDPKHLTPNPYRDVTPSGFGHIVDPPYTRNR